MMQQVKGSISSAIIFSFLEFQGEMRIAASNTYDLQELVRIMQIDPENVRIDVPNDQARQARIK